MPTVSRQACALIRRYIVHEQRAPLLFSFKNIAWPSLWVYLFYKFAVKATGNRVPRLQGDPSPAAEAASNSTTHEPTTWGTGAESLLPLLLMLVVSLHLYYYVVYMVTDKASGMKSLMMSVGLRRISHYLANFACFVVTILPFVLFIAALSIIYLFEESKASALVISTIFLLYILHIGGLMFVLSSLLKIPSMSSIILIASVLEYFIHGQVKSLATSAPGIVMFVASADPYESVILLGDSYKYCQNNGTTMSNGKSVCVSTNMLLVAMLFWTIVAYAFGIWFDKACPWQADTANQGLLYCLKNSSPLDGQEKNEVELPQRAVQSKYFERLSSNRQIGISVKRVSKEFSKKRVINDVSFDIYRGETTLLLGHNGAGKTTLMNIILGRLMPNDGHVRVDRHTDGGIGVCPQTSVCDSFLSVRQHLELFSDIKADLNGDTRERDIDSTMFDVSLERKADSLPSELSGGMRRKLSLGMAFVGKSSILILDEPSSGLDPDSRVFVWNAIRRYRADRTVLLSTQHMEEADYLGDRIAIMSEGKIICCGSSVFLTKTFGSGYKLRVECLESKRLLIGDFARKYFTQAKQSDNEHYIRVPGHEERILDMVLELNDDEDENLEDKLINLLEDIEENSQQLGIKSHALKSSSIEDVLINTSRMADESERQVSSANLTISTSTKDHISALINPVTVHSPSIWFERQALVVAFLRKHLDTYLNDWKSLVVFRVLLVGFVVWRLQADIAREKSINNYSPTYITFALIFHFTHYPIVERTSGFKTMQMTSSADWPLYWLAQLAVDMLTIVLTTVLLYHYTGDVFDSTGKLLAMAATLLFGLAGSLNCYVLSTLFKESGSALAFVAMYFLSGTMMTQFLLPTIGALTDNYERMADWSRNLEMVSVIILPTDALRYTFHGIIRANYVSIGPFDTPPMSWTTDKLPALSTGFCSLVGQTILFGAMLSLIEHYSLDPSTWTRSIWLRCRSICCCRRDDSEGSLLAAYEKTDKDVLGESRKAFAAIDNVPRDKFSLVASDLSKSYSPATRAVDGLSLTVNRGECFGLLGVNGAGKSTTFSMLVGERQPDSGQIWINGRYRNCNKSAYMQKLAYDPQANPAMSLTPVQALSFMARLRRVDEQTVAGLVHAVLEALDMGAHANKRCGQLSGGTLRKLSLGMSLVGGPELLALDEPSAGVDPVARRNIWRLLRELRARKNVAIVISSHAMEECEAVCDRIAIMARGRLRCVGTFLHLRSKFSQGCTVRVQFSPGENLSSFAERIVPDLAARLDRFLGAAVALADTNINSATFSISTSDFRRSSLLSLLREFRQHYPSITYMVSDSSLEDIFIGMAKEQQEPRLLAEATSL